MIMVCKTLGGSHAYGLSTPTSDVDLRGVYLNPDYTDIIGLTKSQDHVKQEGETDEMFHELRKFLALLRKGNSQGVELLFTDKWIELTPQFRDIQLNRYRLIDVDKFFGVMKGYMGGELRLANGERTGKLGSKRKEAIDKYGFSPKNFSHLLRLGWSASQFFLNGVFPVNIMEANPDLGKVLLRIKTNPEEFTVTQLNLMAAEGIEILIDSYKARRVESCFDEKYANKVCLLMYYPVLEKHFSMATGRIAGPQSNIVVNI